MQISSHTFICEGVKIEDNVFIGHGVTFINDLYPRATNQDQKMQTEDDWKVIPTQCQEQCQYRFWIDNSWRCRNWRKRDRRSRIGRNEKRSCKRYCCGQSCKTNKIYRTGINKASTQSYFSSLAKWLVKISSKSPVT